MKWTLSADAVQAASSVIIQTYYISTSVGLNEPTTSLQAKALFGLNISFSLIGITSALVTLCLKTTLLTRMESGSEDDSKYGPNNTEELESDEVPKPVLAKGELLRKAPRLSECELEAFYQSSETLSGKPGFTENPMLDASGKMEEDKVNYKSEYLKVVEANDKMKCENEAVRSENEAVRSENEVLRSEIERLRGDVHPKNNQDTIFDRSNRTSPTLIPKDFR